MRDPCFSSIPQFKTHISCDQFLSLSLFSLDMGIGKKNYELMKAWARVFNATHITFCYNVVTYTAKLYNHKIPNKESQVID